jgi:hypothetical protein
MEPTTAQIKAMQQADAARMVLDNPLVAGAMDTIEREIVGLWADLPIEKKEQAEELKRMLHAARQFRAIFEVMIGGGDVARNELLNADHMQHRMETQRRRIYG